MLEITSKLDNQVQKRIFFMAGSKKWMVYETDQGQKYAVNIDESNGEVADFDDYSIFNEIAGVPLPVLPKGFTMRYANTQNADGINRKIWVGKPASDIMSGVVGAILLSVFTGGGLASSIGFFINSVVGERSGARPSIADTGILDGDAS